jgi:hypothetical protein
LARLLLRYHRRYLRGAIDPDVRFCDYQNHVIHVVDGYWGGAPRVAHQWYDRMQGYLRENRFADAAYAAGVLSHYFTDTFQPLHTQQGELEKVLHVPIEWSITKSYSEIYREWQQDEYRVVFQLSNSPTWLGEAILHGAKFANGKYQQLLLEYNLPQAIEQPRAGLNAHLRAELSEVIGLTVTGWARVLERAAADSEESRQRLLPRPTLVVAGLAALARAPIRCWIRSAERKRMRYQVRQLVQEFTETGSVKQHLPSQVDIVHRVLKVYEDEKRWKQARAQRIPSPTRSANGTDQPVIVAFPEQVDPRAERSVISHQDNLAQMPFMRRHVAARLATVGIDTVGDLIACSPVAIADQLRIDRITAAAISSWQAQAKLRLHTDPDELRSSA